MVFIFILGALTKHLLKMIIKEKKTVNQFDLRGKGKRRKGRKKKRNSSNHGLN